MDGEDLIARSPRVVEFDVALQHNGVTFVAQV
jgi:hypothetical protein